MDEGSSRHPSKLLLKLFQEAWKDLRVESGETDPITTIQIETIDGEKKNVNGFEFWQQMIEEVEKQKDDPDYLFYSPIDEEKIENLFTTTDEPQPGEEPAFYVNGKYYIPRISNLYIQNLNLGYDQWFITQNIFSNPKIIKIVRRKRYVSPTSTDDEIIIELIFAMEISDEMEEEMLANEQKETEEKKKDEENDSETMEVTIIYEKPEMEEFKNSDTELDNSEIIKMDTLVQTEEQQFNTDDIEYVRTIQTIDRDRNQADELEKQLQALEKGHIYMEDVMEMEDSKEMKQMSHKVKFEANSIIDLTLEEEDEVPEKTSYSYDLASCLEDVYAVPKETNQLPHERESQASYSIARNTYQDTLWRDLRPNIATQNVNPQNLGINMNYPNVVTSPNMPVMRPNYGRAPFFIQPGNFRKPVFPYKFCNPYYGHGLRHLIRNPFSLRPQLPFIPLPTHSQPRLFPQHPFTPIQTRLPIHMVPRPLLQNLPRPQTTLLPRLPPRLLFPYLPLIPPQPPLAHTQIYQQPILNSGCPPPAHQTQRNSYGDSTERYQQSVPYPFINPPSQWTPQPRPMIIHNPNIIPNYDSENFQLAHEQPRTQIPQDISPNTDMLNFINAVPAHQSNISTTLASREKMVQDITNENPWEYIVVIKRKSGQTQLIAQAPLSSIIPLPDDDIEDENQDDIDDENQDDIEYENQDDTEDENQDDTEDENQDDIEDENQDDIEDENQDDIEDENQDDIQSGKCVLFENLSIAAKPKKSASKGNQKRRGVHFCRSVIEKDEMKNKSAQSKSLNQKSNENKSNYQPEASFDEREYLQTPSIFEILNSRKDADPNEPQKVPTNYMEDVIQRKERRWKSLDLVPGSPGLDLILDMIRKDNEMLENEERLQREQKAQQIVSPSTARQTDYEKFENMHYDEFEMFPYATYEGAQYLVENTPKINLEPSEITNEPQSPKGITVLNPLDAADILNPSPVTVLAHAFQVHVDLSKNPSNLREFEDVLHKSGEKVSLSACDGIQQKVETIRVLPSADIEDLQEYPTTSQPLQTGTNIHMVEKLKIEIDEEEMALLNNLTTLNKRLSLGVLLPDSAVLQLKEKLNTKCPKSHKSVACVSRENIPAIINPDLILVKKAEKSILFPEKSQISSNENYTQVNKNMRKTNNRETSVSLEDLGTTSRLDQTPIIKPEKKSSLFPEKSQTSCNGSLALANKKRWKTKRRKRSVSMKNPGATSSLDQTLSNRTKKSYSLSRKKSQANSNENQDLAINKIKTFSEESPSERFNDVNETCQLLVARDQATQTIDIDDTEDNLDVAVDERNESTQTDKEIQNILPYSSVVRKNK